YISDRHIFVCIPESPPAELAFQLVLQWSGPERPSSLEREIAARFEARAKGFIQVLDWYLGGNVEGRVRRREIADYSFQLDLRSFITEPGLEPSQRVSFQRGFRIQVECRRPLHSRRPEANLPRRNLACVAGAGDFVNKLRLQVLALDVQRNPLGVVFG